MTYRTQRYKLNHCLQPIPFLDVDPFLVGIFYFQLFRASLPESVQNAIKTVRNLIDTFSLTKPTSLNTIISKMSLSDLNRALYRCDQEERDEGYGFNTYNIPNFGSMVYAGLQGIPDS